MLAEHVQYLYHLVILRHYVYLCTAVVLLHLVTRTQGEARAAWKQEPVVLAILGVAIVIAAAVQHLG